MTLTVDGQCNTNKYKKKKTEKYFPLKQWHRGGPFEFQEL